jgi:hypothetical protein
MTIFTAQWLAVIFALATGKGLNYALFGSFGIWAIGRPKH